MKKFHELSKEKQVQAVDFAATKATELIAEGVIVVDAELTQKDIREIAEFMAEDAWYSEQTDHVIADIADGK